MAPGIDTGLTTMLLASFVGSIAMFGSAAGWGAQPWKPEREPFALALPSLLANAWDNTYKKPCLDKNFVEASDGKCAHCQFGCAADAACPKEKPENTCALKPPTPEEEEANAKTLAAKQSIPRGEFEGKPCPTAFLGITDYSDPDVMSLPNVVPYIYGVFMGAVFALCLGLLSCFSLCFFCAGRCPFGAEYNSGDTCCSYIFKSFGSNMYCPIHPGDNFLVMCMKCILCPGCPNPFFCCHCCCPARVVMNKGKGEHEGQTFIYSGGLEAKGDHFYAYNSAARTEPMSCCGGVYPSIQYGTCGCGEWGCCCDCCFGCCECCNPCCRMNMFDYERSSGSAPGYSLMQGRTLTLSFIIVILLFIIGMSITITGKGLMVCGLNSILPSIVAVLDVMLGWIVDLTGFMMNVSTTLDNVLVAAAIPGTEANNAETTLAGLSGAVEAGYNLKLSLCGAFSIGIEEISAAFGSVIDIVCYMGFAVLGLGLIGWLRYVIPISVGRCTLVGGSLSLCCGFLAIILYVVVDPLSLLVGDLCVLLEGVKRNGSMVGFPGGKPPALCGGNGSMAAFPDTVNTINDKTKMLQCQAYSELCNMPSLPAGTSGTTALIGCPVGLATDAHAFYFDDSIPSVPTLEYDQCTVEKITNYTKWFAELDGRSAGTKVANIRYGCPDVKISNQVMNFNFEALETGKQCDLTFDFVPMYAPETADSKWCKSDKARVGDCTPDSPVPADRPTTGQAQCPPTTVGAGATLFYCFGGPTAAAIGPSDTTYANQPIASQFRINFHKSNPEFIGLLLNVNSEFTTAATASANTVSETKVSWTPVTDDDCAKGKKSSDALCEAVCKTEGAALGTYTAAGDMIVSSGSVGSLGVKAYADVPMFVGGAWSTASSAYEYKNNGRTGSKCTFKASGADAALGNANIGCAPFERMPLPCQVDTVTMKECAASKTNTATLPSKVCDVPSMRIKSAAISGFDDVINQIDGLLAAYGQPFGYECENADDANCLAGRAMFELINCGFITAIATETYVSLCDQLGNGLLNMGSGFAVFFIGYNLAFIVFLLGYKRWNRKYHEGYTMDAGEDHKGNWKSDGEAAGAEGQHGGYVAAMCASLSLGCSAGHSPAVGDVIVFGDGQHHQHVVTEEQTVKKSGYALTKHDEASKPNEGGGAYGASTGIEMTEEGRAEQDKKSIESTQI